MITKQVNKLVEALTNRPQEHNDYLEEQRSIAIKTNKREDWFWYRLLAAMATLGNRRGFKGLMEKSEKYSLVEYRNLVNVNPNNRKNIIANALEGTGIRFFSIKANRIEQNLAIIEGFGGLNIVQEFIRGMKDKETKVLFLKLFEGIGDKYARDVMMSIYDPHFLDSIELDSNVLKISNKLGIDTKSMSYQEHEAIYLTIAQKANCTLWEVDRLLFEFTKYYLSKI